MVQNGYLYTNLADRILQYIRKNELKAGDRLPAERELATLFSSSRSSVREAVRILQNQGIIETEVGRGMFLRRIPPPTVIISLSGRWTIPSFWT
jgi:GntR family transcriptional repressor for pyruvate dehydrogenase complex